MRRLACQLVARQIQRLQADEMRQTSRNKPFSSRVIHAKGENLNEIHFKGRHDREGRDVQLGEEGNSLENLLLYKLSD